MDVSRCLGLDPIEGNRFERKVGRAVSRFTQELLAIVDPQTGHAPVALTRRPPRVACTAPKVRAPKPRVDVHDAARDSADAKRVHEVLVDALGELYGAGQITAPVEKSGRIDWTKLAELSGAPVRRAEFIATTYYRRVLQEIEDYVTSHRDPIERWLKSRRLGLPSDP
jgi:hypothetical protein